MKNKQIKVILYLIALGLFIFPLYTFFPIPKENLSGVVFIGAFTSTVPFFWFAALVFLGLGKYFSRPDKNIPDIITQYKTSSPGQNFVRTIKLIILILIFTLVIYKITSINF